MKGRLEPNILNDNDNFPLDQENMEKKIIEFCFFLCENPVKRSVHNYEYHQKYTVMILSFMTDRPGQTV